MRSITLGGRFFVLTGALYFIKHYLSMRSGAERNKAILLDIQLIYVIGVSYLVCRSTIRRNGLGACR